MSPRAWRAGRRLAAVMLPLALAAALWSGVAQAAPQPETRAAADGVELLLFWGDGCPHCEAEREFLVDLQERHPGLTIRQYEVWFDEQNRALLERTAAGAGIEPQGVPVTFVGELSWIGFSDAIALEIEDAVATSLQGGTPEVSKQAIVDIPFIGSVDVGSTSLVVSTLVIGFVDGVNPCSLWVLTMLLALVLHSRSRRRVLIVGGTFLLITSGMYALYIVGFYSVLSYVGYVTWIQRGVAVIAGGLGLLQLKDYFWYHEGPTLGIADERKPGLFRRMRGLATQERSLGGVLVATAVLAVGVSLLETPCTLGLPLMWTNLLAQQQVELGGAALLFALYMGVFLLDELIVFGVAVATMRATKLQERHGRELKLVSGVVMIFLAGVMLLAPTLMESTTGALGVFGGAALLVAVVIGVSRRFAAGEPAEESQPTVRR